MKKEELILIGIGVLGLVYLIRREIAQQQKNTVENIVDNNLEARIPNFEHIVETTPKKTDTIIKKTDNIIKKTDNIIKKTDNIIVRNALKNYQLSNAVIKAYIDPELSQVLPTQPTELKTVLYPLFRGERRVDSFVPRDIRIPY